MQPWMPPARDGQLEHVFFRTAHCTASICGVLDGTAARQWAGSGQAEERRGRPSLFSSLLPGLGLGTGIRRVANALRCHFGPSEFHLCSRFQHGRSGKCAVAKFPFQKSAWIFQLHFIRRRSAHGNWPGPSWHGHSRTQCTADLPDLGSTMSCLRPFKTELPSLTQRLENLTTVCTQENKSKKLGDPINPQRGHAGSGPAQQSPRSFLGSQTRSAPAPRLSCEMQTPQTPPSPQVVFQHTFCAPAMTRTETRMPGPDIY